MRKLSVSGLVWLVGSFWSASVSAQELPKLRIVVVGDSTVASYPNPPADRPELTGWGQVLGEYFLPNVQVFNHAKSGHSSKSFLGGTLWRNALADKPTHVLVQFGHNDCPGKGDRATDPQKDFPEYLKRYLDESRQAGAKPILLTPVARRTFQEGKLTTILQPYADAMHKLGKETKTPVLDLHARSSALYTQLGDEGSTDLCVVPTDRTHFSKKGARAIAKLVIEDLAQLVPELEASYKFPLALTRFQAHGKNPLFGPADKQSWDAKLRERGWILKENDHYKLWYTGYDGSQTGTRLLGLATSTDGVTWRRQGQSPLVKDHWIEDMMVVKQAGTYFMFAEGAQDRAQLLTSTDGIAWQKQGKLDVRHKDGTPLPDGPLGTPTAWFEHDRWHLFFERQDLGVWLATSKDTKSWQQVQDAPVLTPGPGDYDKDLVALNQIVKHQGRYFAYYHGSAKTGPTAKLWSTALATSTDLLHWEKYPGNPLLPTKVNLSSGIVVPDGKQYRLYTMHPEVHLHLPPSGK